MVTATLKYKSEAIFYPPFAYSLFVCPFVSLNCVLCVALLILSIHPSIHPFHQSLFIHLFVHSFICPFIFILICWSIYRSVYLLGLSNLSIYLTTYLLTYLCTSSWGDRYPFLTLRPTCKAWLFFFLQVMDALSNNTTSVAVTRAHSAPTTDQITMLDWVCGGLEGLGGSGGSGVIWDLGKAVDRARKSIMANLTSAGHHVQSILATGNVITFSMQL